MLHKLISKLVLFTMLFTGFPSSVNASYLCAQNTELKSTSQAMPIACCNDTTSNMVLSMCSDHESSAMAGIDNDDIASTGSCCADGDCHSQATPLAILASLNFAAIQADNGIHTDPVGELFQRKEPIFRPPSFVFV